MRDILALGDTDSSVLVIRFLQKHHEEVSHIWIDLSAIGSEEVLGEVFDSLSKYWWFNGHYRRTISDALENFKAGKELNLCRTIGQLVPQHTVVEYLP